LCTNHNLERNGKENRKSMKCLVARGEKKVPLFPLLIFKK